MVDVRTVTGGTSLLGGAAWVGMCFAQNTLPQGCIGDGCLERPMRGSSDLASSLSVVAALLLAVSVVGFVVMARRRGQWGRSSSVGVAAVAAGLFLLLAAGVMSVVDGDWEGMPGLVVPGVLLLAIGLLLVAWMVLRSQALPTWVAVLMLVTVLLLPFSNEQTSRVLLAVPFGLAWMLAGAVLLRRPSERQLISSSMSENPDASP